MLWADTGLGFMVWSFLFLCILIAGTCLLYIRVDATNYDSVSLNTKGSMLLKLDEWTMEKVIGLAMVSIAGIYWLYVLWCCFTGKTVEESKEQIDISQIDYNDLELGVQLDTISKTKLSVEGLGWLGPRTYKLNDTLVKFTKDGQDIYYANDPSQKIIPRAQWKKGG